MKKIIGIYLLLQAVLKSVCLLLSLQSDESSLPVVIMVFCTILIAGSVYVAVLTFMEKARLRQISRFFILEIALTVFNIGFMVFQPAELIATDTWVTGNLFDVLVAGVLLFYLTRQKYYIRSKYVVGTQEAEETIAAEHGVQPLV